VGKPLKRALALALEEINSDCRYRGRLGKKVGAEGWTAIIAAAFSTIAGRLGRKGIPNFPDDSFSSGNAGGKLRVPTQIILSGERRALLFADQLGRLNF